MDVFTTTATLGNQIIAAYDRRALMALREDAIFKQYARVKPGNMTTSPGSSATFTFWDDLTPALEPLSETVDVDAVGLSDSQVTLTPKEYGNSVLVTIKARAQTFNLGFDSDVADIVSYNMVDTVEHLAANALDESGTAHQVDGTTDPANLVATDVLTMAEVRKHIQKLRGAKVRPSSGNLYDVVLHPDVSFDLFQDDDGAAWQDLKHTDSGPLRIGKLGSFAGANFIENSRARILEDGGTGGVDVYTTYIFGAEAFGMVEQIPLHIVPGPVTDRLMRFMPLGWYGLLGFGGIREAALRRVLSASSIGDNE